MPELAFISLGSNVEPEVHLPMAVLRLARLGKLRAVSAVYQNPAVGPTPQPDFLNAAVLLETGLDARQLRRRLRRIEAGMGRKRSQDKYAPRSIDLDLCLLGQQVVEANGLSLPAPDLLTRPHVAIPVAELAPDFVHPLTGERLQAIAERLRPGAILSPRQDVNLRFE